MDVTQTMKIRGTAFNPGLTAPKMGKNYAGNMVKYGSSSKRGRRIGTYSENDEEQEKDVGDVVELEPQVFRDEGYRGILGRSNLVPGEKLPWQAILIKQVLRKRLVEKEQARGALLLILLLMPLQCLVVGVPYG
jgi:hypothetical protein